MLDIVLLGTGGGMPIPERYLSSLLINYRGRKILIDCGEGTQIAMRKEHTGFKSTDIICITHFHGDHILGLPGLLSTMGNSNRIRPVTIIGPKGLNEIMDGLKIVIPYLPFELNIIEVYDEDLSFSISSEGLNLKEDEGNSRGDIIISTMELDHSDPCIGYSFYIPRSPKFDLNKAKENRIPREHWKALQNLETVIEDDVEYKPSMVLGQKREGIRLSFVTDTRPTESIVDFIRGSNLFVCEGTYGADEDIEKAIENKHMTFGEAAKLAKDGEVDKLLLTHFSPSVENPEKYKINAMKIFTNTIIGYDGYGETISFEE